MRHFIVGLLAASLAVAAPPATMPKASPEDVGISAERLRRVHAVMQKYIDRGEIAGAVTLVSRKGRVALFESQGVMDVASKAPLRTDTIFRLASMTKPITSLAVMMLHEEGHFILNDPISKFLPEFKNPKVAVANKPNERSPEGFHLVPADREITIHDLMTHTAGLPGGDTGSTRDLVKRLNAARKPTDTLADYIPQLAALPLNFQPGTAWEYGPAVDVQGRLVEVISGMTLDRFFRERIFKPLGMNDTYFYLPDEKLSRLVTAYEKKDGVLTRLTAEGPASRNGKYFSGGGGLASTSEDYLRFAQMSLNGGQLDGTRLVGRKTIEAMTTGHIGKIPLWQDTLKGHTFGLGYRIRSDVGESGILGSVGSYGWGGAYGTYFFIDPKEQTIGIMMIQLMPYAHLNIRQEFHNAVMQSIVD